jgi:hypothetical protein
LISQQTTYLLKINGLQNQMKKPLHCFSPIGRELNQQKSKRFSVGAKNGEDRLRLNNAQTKNRFLFGIVLGLHYLCLKNWTNIH